MLAVAAALACVLCGIQEGSAAQAQSVLAAWVTQQRAAAEVGVDLEYARATWRVEKTFVPPVEQLRAMRSRVAGHPDHPERDSLKAYERRLQQGPDIERYDIWLGPRGSFRRNLVDVSGNFEDLAVQPARSWSSSGHSRHVNLVETGNSAPQGYNYKPWDTQLRGTLAGFAYGAFSIRFPGAPMAMATLTTDGGRWRAVFATDEPRLSLAIDGSWDADLQLGTADQAVVLACDPAPDEVGRRWTFTDWVEDNVLTPQMSRVQTSYTPMGQVESIIILEGIDRISRRDFATVVSPPDAKSQTDSVRGSIAISTVHKVSGTSEPSIVTVFDSTGAQLAEIPQRDFDQNLEKRLLRNAVLMGVPGIVVLIIGGALWRRARRAAS